MAKISSKKITISPDELEDFIWMSYRYCIGRHTIAANMHASTVAQYVHFLSDARQDFMATDIRREIADCLRFKSNFLISGYCDASDPVSIWFEYLISNNIVVNDSYLKESKFTINTDTKEVFIDSIELGDNKYDYQYNTLSTDIHDLLVWIKLANYLDKKVHKFVIIEDKECEAFPYYIFDNGIPEKLWITCEQYKKNPGINRYIAKDSLKFKD